MAIKNSIFLAGLLFSMINLSAQKTFTNSASITVNVRNSDPIDSLIIDIWDENISDPRSHPPGYSKPDNEIPIRTIKGQRSINDSSFTFSIPMNGYPVYVSIGVGRNAKHGIIIPILDEYIVEPSDKITIALSGVKVKGQIVSYSQIEFYGFGSTKYQCIYEINKKSTESKNLTP